MPHIFGEGFPNFLSQVHRHLRQQRLCRPHYYSLNQPPHKRSVETRIHAWHGALWGLPHIHIIVEVAIHRENPSKANRRVPLATPFLEVFEEFPDACKATKPTLCWERFLSHHFLHPALYGLYFRSSFANEYKI